MSAKIRLARFGKKKSPFYRVVVTDSRKSRDGKYIELLGTYNPFEEVDKLKINQERTKSWLKQGAVPTLTVRELLQGTEAYVIEKTSSKKKNKRKGRGNPIAEKKEEKKKLEKAKKEVKVKAVSKEEEKVTTDVKKPE